jgi:DNA (cytosine-5)-methyltransferase 1
MIAPHEMIVDLFAGGGGASTGILQATGRHPDLAVNHDAVAIACHTANHPTTRHEQASIWAVEPRAVCAGRPVGLLWASPDCRHFSRASGGRPRWKSVRSLPGVVITWATRVRPRIIVVENVPEFITWGPLLDDGRPCPARVGRSFRAWAGRLRGMGYTVEWRELCAADFGAPTIRTRLFVVARCDGEPIRWPAPTHSRHGGLIEARWRSAAECIRWDVPAPSIFDRKRPLAPATCRRIAAGIAKFVMGAGEPFTMHLTHHGAERCQSLHAPMRTITSANRGEMALVAPALSTLVQVGWGERAGQAPRVPGLDKPLGTVCAGGNKHALVAPVLATIDHQSNPAGISAATAPIGVITAKARHVLAAAFLAQHNGGTIGRAASAPASTITTTGTQTQLVTAVLAPEALDRAEQVAAFLVRYNGTNIGQPMTEPLGTMTTKPRFALAQVAGVPHVITDIGMRMLLPEELSAAQGLPAGYRLPATKTDAIRLIGNSVSPPPAAALLRALLAPGRAERIAA